mgnify:CR=1 FL=1
MRPITRLHTHTHMPLRLCFFVLFNTHRSLRKAADKVLLILAEVEQVRLWGLCGAVTTVYRGSTCRLAVVTSRITVK